MHGQRMSIDLRLVRGPQPRAVPIGAM